VVGALSLLFRCAVPRASVQSCDHGLGSRAIGFRQQSSDRLFGRRDSAASSAPRDCLFRRLCAPRDGFQSRDRLSEPRDCLFQQPCDHPFGNRGVIIFGGRGRVFGSRAIAFFR
jgi:hypothetical protein